MRRIIIIHKDSVDPDKEREFLRTLLNKFKHRLNHIIIRVDKRHIEVDVDSDEVTLSNITSFLKENGYNIADEVKVEENGRSLDGWREKLLELYNQGRFWEIHEMLEAIWRKEKDNFVRAMIFFVIPYIKIQMGQYKEALRGFQRFLEYKCEEEKKYGIDIGCLKKEIKKMIENKNVISYTPINIKRCIEG